MLRLISAKIKNMNSFAKTSIALLLILLTTLRTLASENASFEREVLSQSVQKFTAPVMISKREILSAPDRAKYTLMSDQARSLARKEAAGASSTQKTVLIVVGVVVVGLVVLVVASAASLPAA